MARRGPRGPDRQRRRRRKSLMKGAGRGSFKRFGRVTFEDQGLQRLYDNLAAMRSMKVHVGFLPPDGRKKVPGRRLSMAELAISHEFGFKGRYPARSFMRTAIQKHRKAITSYAEQQIALMIQDLQGPEDAMENIGRHVLGLIRQKLESMMLAPVDPETAARKGSANPLVESGQMSSAMSYQVKRGVKMVRKGRR